MKTQCSILLVAAVAGLAAADCNGNNCLRAVIGSAFTTRDGVRDCSSLLAVTVTPATSTVTSTVTVLPTVYTTVVGTDLSTTSQTTTVSTQTVGFTAQQTQTASTETDFTTITVTANAATLKARLATQTSATYPAYASPCSVWSKYVSACSCVGVFPTTVSAATPVTTTVVYETTTVTSSVLSTVSSTETDVISVTASTSTTETQIVSVTDTTLATITQTAVPSVAPVSVCNPIAGAFKAHATQYSGQDEYIYANLLNGLTGGLTWNLASTSTSTSVQNKYIWAIDSAGHLGLAYNVPPYSYKYTVYMSTASSGSNWPQVNTKTAVDAQVAAGAAVTYVNACVDSLTGELKLNAAGRTQILWCGQQLWMSNTLGSDINRGTCVQMFPTVVMV